MIIFSPGADPALNTVKPYVAKVLLKEIFRIGSMAPGKTFAS
jgi:hypothetical protein